MNQCKNQIRQYALSPRMRITIPSMCEKPYNLSALCPVIRHLYQRLVQSVTTIDGNVRAGHEGGGIGSKEDGKAVEVVDGTEARLWGQGLPDLLLCIKCGNVVESSVHITYYMLAQGIGSRGKGTDLERCS
jgi:hypothetical protein